MSTNSTLPAAHRAKVISDLPNEVLARICEFLVPNRSEAKTLTDSELDLQSVDKSVEGAAEYRLWENLDRNRPGYPGLQSFDNPNKMTVSIHKHENKENFPNHFADFASTCKLVSNQALYIASRRSFLLTISNTGLTFEGIRDAAPLQLFGNNGAYAMVDDRNMRMQIVPNGSVPGNKAFTAFTQAMGNLTRLRLKFRIDLARTGSGRTRFFIEQVASQFSALQEQGSRLSEVIVTVVLGYWSTERHRTTGSPFHTTLIEVMQCMNGQDDKTFAEVAAQITGRILEPVTQALQALSISKIHPRCHTACPGSRKVHSSIGMKLDVQWDDPDLSWGVQTEAFISGAGMAPQLIRIPRDWGSLELLRDKLEQHLRRNATGTIPYRTL
ncbi:hypothetical protein H2200_004495 [Cladophialophora chaetospira]|uniref:F-box domain-containing protein n=1 Tax=Cladophialophora chaetospira TaxID=386627 RepID=A0AA39CKJ7_9EURO|nr:hypothetical protein H2200_004495 [Cladophialophora chaetospira]